MKKVFSCKKNKLSAQSLMLDSVYGCLLGGAYGDALGYPIEFLQLSQIIECYGKDGITELKLRNGKAEISDDTQMTLFTANALLLADTIGSMRTNKVPLNIYILKLSILVDTFFTRIFSK